MRGYSPTRVLTALGISRGSLSRWREGGEPRNEYKKAIADYLGVTVPELVSGETKKPITKSDELDDEMAELLEEVRKNPDLRALFSISKKATPEDIRKTIAIMRTIKGEND